ncbi:hypothetical protein [Hymenobacter sp. PAMC 26628]|uniref:hypothetical protein n=1 Tax=Hymenobacter sp. PAMC 26628 TaxID=1484118 RepID=UPI00076FE683|nr:hypothetical protein [Hymenobacter sp. PAMC 26628]AMJ64500.1 hypothetical protein AXW84_02960 [Hymenobacter sp. PAMC 26628]
MQKNTRRWAFAAICLYTAAFLATVLLHELAHALMALAAGVHSTLFNSHVDAPPAGPRQEILIALAGPVFSLAQGVAALTLTARGRSTGPGALFGLFLGVFGIINFLGYVMTSPVVDYGDVGQAEKLLGVPVAAAVVAAVAAAVAVVLAVQRTAPLFLRFVPASGLGVGPTEVVAQKRPYLRALLLWPWLLGSVVITALSWPWPTVLIVYPPMSSAGSGVWGRHRPGRFAGGPRRRPPCCGHHGVRWRWGPWRRGIGCCAQACGCEGGHKTTKKPASG